MRAAERVLLDMERDLVAWQSYGGPIMPGQREVEQKIAGAKMVLAAMKEAGRSSNSEPPSLCPATFQPGSD